MTDTDNINNEIQQSLKNFTEHLSAFSSDQFSEMRKCSFFDAVPDELLANLVKVTNLITFKAGDKIIIENDSIRFFYVILFGTATVYVQQKEVGNILSGECFGEGAFFSKETQARSASVVADNEVIALEMDKSNMDAIDAETQKYLNKALLLAIFKKLHAANIKINALTCENELLNHAHPIDLWPMQGEF